MSYSRAVLALSTLIVGCSQTPVGHPQEEATVTIPAPMGSVAHAWPTVSSPLPSASAAEDPKWRARCAESITAGLQAAGAYDPGIARAYVLDDPGDEVSVANPMGFFLSVRKVAPDLRTVDPPGIWQHRAESLHGSYHVMFAKDSGRVTAAIAFDGWPSPRVQPLLPILQSAVDTCFID